MSQNVRADNISGVVISDKDSISDGVPLKRVIILLDVDCYHVQLWIKHLRPELVGKDVPVVVVDDSNVIRSVNYTAKRLGVKRGEGQQSLIDARELCEQAGRQLVEITAPERNGKPDTFRPITESDVILDAIRSCPVFQIWTHSNNGEKFILLERKNDDEFYIDVTQLVEKSRIQGELNYVEYYDSKYPRDEFLLLPFPSEEEFRLLSIFKNHPNGEYNGKPSVVLEGRERTIAGAKILKRIKELENEGYYLDELRLIHGAIIASSIMEHIKRKTGYDVSAGVGHSKLVAKLACGRNKPKGISVLTDESLPRLSKTIPFQDIPGYGGNMGRDIRNGLLAVQNKDVKYIDDIMCLRSSNGDLDLLAVFNKLNLREVRDPVKTSKDLQSKCEFKDDSLVTSKVYHDTITTGMTFKGNLGPQKFKDLSTDIAGRVNYFKTRGRHATELCVKATMIKNARVSPVGRSNRIPLPKNCLATPECVNKLVWDYISQNGLSPHEIAEIHFVASNIIVP